MNGNKIIKTFILPLLVIAGLLALHYLPEIEISEGNALRQVDILADVKLGGGSHMTEADSIFLAEEERERKAMFANDSIFPGVVPIEDYSPADAEVRMMDYFYSKLDTISKLNRPLRIAYYGDSFIGGDIMTSHLREHFQNQYGGCGIGAFEIVAPGSRSTLKQTTEGIVPHLATKPDFSADKQGISNSYYLSESKSVVRMNGTTRATAHVDCWPKSSLFFRPVNNAAVYCSINGGESVEKFSGQSNALQVVSASGNINSIEWQMRGKGNYYFFAVNEDTVGVTIDNFSLVSSSGLLLKGLSLPVLKEFAALRQYDLIVFQYGLNVSVPKSLNFDYYSKPFGEIIENFRQAWPDAALMITSVSDRCKGMNNGQPTTMKGIEELVAAQRAMAKEHKIAFWNLFSVMKSFGGIAGMAKNGEAYKDYTHMTYNGGQHIADKFYDAFKNGMFNYKRRYNKQ